MYIRTVLGLDSDLVVNLKVDTLTSESLSNLSHGVQLVDILIRHNAHSLGAHILEIHTDLLSDAGAESDGRGGHLKGILFLAWMCRGRGIFALVSVSRGDDGWWLFVISRVGMTGARRRMGVLDCTQQVAGSRSSLVEAMSVIQGHE